MKRKSNKNTGDKPAKSETARVAPAAAPKNQNQTNEDQAKAFDGDSTPRPPAVNTSGQQDEPTRVVAGAKPDGQKLDVAEQGKNSEPGAKPVEVNTDVEIKPFVLTGQIEFVPVVKLVTHHL